MEKILMIMLGISLFSVLLVLFLGLVVFVRGGEVNSKYGNKLMQLRVITQTVSISIIIVLVAIRVAGD